MIILSSIDSSSRIDKKECCKIDTPCKSCGSYEWFLPVSCDYGEFITRSDCCSTFLVALEVEGQIIESRPKTSDKIRKLRIVKPFRQNVV
jgi:hypothetical protein